MYFTNHFLLEIRKKQYRSGFMFTKDGWKKVYSYGRRLFAVLLVFLLVVQPLLSSAVLSVHADDGEIVDMQEEGGEKEGGSVELPEDEPVILKAEEPDEEIKDADLGGSLTLKAAPGGSDTDPEGGDPEECRV